jgi:hypothetical protein
MRPSSGVAAAVSAVTMCALREELRQKADTWEEQVVQFQLLGELEVLRGRRQLLKIGQSPGW